jgi:hypothetical protein
LDYDIHAGDDGKRWASPVLVHDMTKTGKTGYPLPVHQRETDIISAQQERARVAYPDRPTERLVLFPRTLKTPPAPRRSAPRTYSARCAPG